MGFMHLRVKSAGSSVKLRMLIPNLVRSLIVERRPPEGVVKPPLMAKVQSRVTSDDGASKFCLAGWDDGVRRSHAERLED